MRWRVALLSALLGANNAEAQSTPPPAPAEEATAPGEAQVSAEALTAARRVVVSADMEQTMLRAMDHLIPVILEPLARAYGLTAEQQRTVAQVLTEESRRDPGPLVDMIAQTYARRLSIQDLNAAADFYESPSGRHVIEALPGLQSDMLAVGRAWGEQVLAPRVLERFEQMRQDDIGPT